MVDCIFCKIISGEIPSRKVHEDENTFAFLDINPASKGHVLLVPKQHFRLIYEGDPGIVAEVFKKAAILSKRLVERLGCTGFNILVNQGKDGGQVIDHFHVHVIPRYKDDGLSIPHPLRKTTEAELDEVHALITG